jgi:methylated-DNA-protein-cysteine methyltransferase-like protein
MARSEDSEHLRRLYKQLYGVIRKIPKGRVATYGQVAELAGIPGGARIAAASLKVSKPSDGLPWQRVIGKASKTRGRIAIHDPVGAAIQRQLLEGEGVTINDTGLVDLTVFAWGVPRRAPRRAPKKKRAPTRRRRS